MAYSALRTSRQPHLVIDLTTTSNPFPYPIVSLYTFYYLYYVVIRNTVRLWLMCWLRVHLNDAQHDTLFLHLARRHSHIPLTDRSPNTCSLYTSTNLTNSALITDYLLSHPSHSSTVSMNESSLNRCMSVFKKETLHF